MSVDLLYHVVDAREEVLVLASFMVAREFLCGGDEKLVVNIEWGGLHLWESQFCK